VRILRQEARDGGAVRASSRRTQLSGGAAQLLTLVELAHVDVVAHAYGLAVAQPPHVRNGTSSVSRTPLGRSLKAAHHDHRVASP